MEEGTGIGLYILVAMIIFGAFVLIAIFFGDEIRTIFNRMFGQSTGIADAALTEAQTKLAVNRTP